MQNKILFLDRHRVGWISDWRIQRLVLLWCPSECDTTRYFNQSPQVSDTKTNNILSAIELHLPRNTVNGYHLNNIYFFIMWTSINWIFRYKDMLKILQDMYKEDFTIISHEVHYISYGPWSNDNLQQTLLRWTW